MKHETNSMFNNVRFSIFAFGLMSLLIANLTYCETDTQHSAKDVALHRASQFSTPVVFVQDEPEILDLSFNDVKFEMEKGEKFKDSMLTDEIRAMEGKRIKIRGYMQPSFKQKGIKSFVFVRDNQECCFGPGAALYDCMIVKLKKGKSTSFQIRPFAVEGTFSIKEYEGPDGEPWAIFRLSDAVVK